MALRDHANRGEVRPCLLLQVPSLEPCLPLPGILCPMAPWRTTPLLDWDFLVSDLWSPGHLLLGLGAGSHSSAATVVAFPTCMLPQLLWPGIWGEGLLH